MHALLDVSPFAYPVCGTTYNLSTEHSTASPVWKLSSDKNLSYAMTMVEIGVKSAGSTASNIACGIILVGTMPGRTVFMRMLSFWKW